MSYVKKRFELSNNYYNKTRYSLKFISFPKQYIKVKEEIKLVDYLYACIVPEQYKNKIVKHISPELSEKVYYLTQKGMTLQHWNQKVVEFIDKL